jgi:hypothetical protein
MSSNINYASINENFPVAGQDNDTQVFRDNFDTIKNSLSTAKAEVTDLIENTARVDGDNDFSGNRIVNAVFRNVKRLKYAPSGVVSAPEGESSINTEINYQNGMYQIYRFASNSNINFEGLPIDNYAKMTLEIYGDGSARTLSFTATGGTVFKKNSTFPGTFTVTSSIDPVILEVWRHDSNKIFLNYLGQFS